MTQFFADAFEGTDGTDLITYSAGWKRTSSSPGGINLLVGRAKHNSGSSASAYYRSDAAPPSADYTVRGKFYFGAQAGSGASVGVCGRMLATSQNFYSARFLTGTGLVLVKAIANTASTLATYPYTPVADTEVVVDLKMVGDQISVYLNDALVLGPITDSSLTAAGFPGLRMINASQQVQVSEMSADDGVVAGGSTTIVSPAKASLSVAGFAPTIGRTANQAVSPANASLAVQGFAPVVARSANQSVAPGAASVSVRGYAPSITQSAGGSVSPAPAALAVRSFAPTIVQTTTRMLTPAPAALQVRGFAPTISQPGQSTGTPPESSTSGGGGAYGGSGSMREVRAFADLLDSAEKPTKNERKRRKRAIEAAVLELLPDELAAEKAAPVIAQMVARDLPATVWAPVRTMQPVAQPRALPAAVVEDVRARVAEWLAEQERLASLEDDFETELLLMG